MFSWIATEKHFRSISDEEWPHLPLYVKPVSFASHSKLRHMWSLTLISHLIPKRIWVGNLEDVISNKQQILFEHLICAKSQPQQTVLTLSSHTVHKSQWIYSLHNTSLAYYLFHLSFIGPLTLIFVIFLPSTQYKVSLRQDRFLHSPHDLTQHWEMGICSNVFIEGISFQVVWFVCESAYWYVLISKPVCIQVFMYFVSCSERDKVVFFKTGNEDRESNG